MMNKSTIIIADGNEDELEMTRKAAGRLEVGVPLEFLKSGDEHWDRIAGLVIRAAIFCLLFLVVVFVGFLIYLALR